MEFINKVITLNPERTSSFTLGKGYEIKIPTAQDVFFKSKQDEIFKQYQTARMFLYETETKDLEHWFTGYDKSKEEIVRLTFMTEMYETALIYYNIIVDLSWTLCYVSIEYALYSKESTIELSNFMSIEDAYNTMRKIENLVTNPGVDGNPLEYLKLMCPEFEESIDWIIEFWKSFKDSDIRKTYNFLKHKGKPTYCEIEEIVGKKVMNLTIDGNRCPIDISDVKMEVELFKSISELREFDDEILFPYIKRLFELLETQINPSKMIL